MTETITDRGITAEAEEIRIGAERIRLGFDADWIEFSRRDAGVLTVFAVTIVRH